jgi:hypothetical protein
MQLSVVCCLMELPVLLPLAMLPLLLQGHPGDTSLFVLPAHAESPTSISASLNIHKPHTLAPAAAAAAAAVKPAVQTSVQVHNLAIGLDGILKIVAAVEAATAGPQHATAAAAAGGSSSSSSSRNAAEIPEQQPVEATSAATQSSSSGGSSSNFKLHLELLQCQLLSCKAAAAAAATAHNVAELMPWEVPLQQLPTCRAADGVLCDLLLDLPYISLNLGQTAAAAAACQDAEPAAASAKPPPMVLVQGLGVYLPEAPGSGVLLPVLSIPSVLFRQSQQQQQGDAVLHEVHIPAVGASLRPLQVQHLVQMVEQQKNQWQQWTAGIPAKQPKQKKQHQPKQQQQQQQLQVMLDDLQLLLLPAHGISDKGLLLQLQQLQVQHEQNMLQPGVPDASSSSSSRVLQQAKVCWSELSLSAVQQQDDAAATDNSSHWLGADNAPASAAAQHGVNLGPNQQQQQQQGELRLLASSLPAVAWLLRTGSSSRSSTGQQLYQQLLPLPSGAFATAAVSAAVAAAGGGGGGTASGSGLGAPRLSAALPRTSSGALREALSNQATLTRFLSAKDSWHGGSVVGSVVSAESFVSAHGSSNALLGSSSGSSWVTAGASSSHSSAAAAAARGSSISGSRTAAAAAAAVPMLDPQSSIIAASWQLDPPGASPPAGLGVCGSLPVSVAQSPSASRTANAAVAGGASRPPLQPVSSSVQQQQQQGFATTEPSTAQAHQLQPSRRSISFSGGGGASALHGGVSASSGSAGPNLWRRSASPPGLLSTSLRNVHSAGGLGSSSGQGLGQVQGLGLAGQSFSSHWQDDDAEFYSIAGDSSAADDVSATGDDDDPHQQQHGQRIRCSSTGGTPSAAAAAKCGAGALEDDSLLLTELLPLAGFDGEGCLATARWLLLSLSAGYSSSSSSSSTAPAAVQVTVAEELSPAPAAAAGGSSSRSRSEQQLVLQQQRTIIRVLLQGWQLHISGKYWDMAAACIMQAVNAAASVNRKPKAPRNRPSQQQQQQQHKQEVQLLLDVQKLQAMLFLAPEAAAPCNPRQLKQQQQQPEVSHSSRDCGPWQDPGNSPTAAAAAGGFGRRSAGPGAAASRDEQQQQLAAETVTLELSASAELGTPGSSSSSSKRAPPDSQQQRLVLQSSTVPELSVHVGAALWDAAAARPVGSAGAGSAEAAAGNAAGSSEQQQQQEHALLLLLLKGLELQHTAASGAGVKHADAGAASDAVHSDDGTMATAASDLSSEAGPQLTSCIESNPSDGSSPGFEVHVGSISGWVSTTRLSLLLNLQQQLMAKLPAISAAADLAGGAAKYRGDPAAAAAAVDSAAGVATAGTASSGDAYAADALSSSNTRSMPAAASGVLAAASSSGIGSSSNSRSARLPDSSSRMMAAVQQVVVCSLTVHKLAVLCSTDEPDPWLLQQHSSSRGVATSSAAAAAAAAVGVASTSSAGSSVDSSTAVPFTTCATPLLELALLPLQIDVRLVTTTAAAAGRSNGSSSRRVVEVAVRGSCCADVYSVDKLGWEPLLDPWEFKVRSSSVVGVKSWEGN